MLFKKKREIIRNPILPILKKIKNLRGEEISKESATKLKEILRDYLKSKFKFPLSLTSEELVKRLDLKKINKTIKLDLVHLISEIDHFEYEQKNLPTKEEFDSLTKLAFKTIEEISIGKTISEEEISGRGVQKVKEVNKNLEALEKKLDSLGKDFKIDWKDQKTREEYSRIREEYSKLKEREKLKIYPKIKTIFKLSKN